MRDLHRMKEKHSLSLDSRHLGTLAVVGVLVAGGVFGLGVMVGKKLGAEERGGQANQGSPDLLSALDAQAAALESAQRDASLSFQEELTKRNGPVVVAEAPKPAPRPPEPVKADAPKPEPVKAPEPAPPPLSAAFEQVAAHVPAPVIKESPPKAEPVATRTNDAGALKETFAKAGQKAPEAAADGQWTLQLSAYQDKAEADRFAGGLRDRGYAPFIVEAVVPGKGTWWRVRMGRFANRDAAGRYLADFKRETSLDAMVTPSGK